MAETLEAELVKAAQLLIDETNDTMLAALRFVWGSTNVECIRRARERLENALARFKAEAADAKV